MSKRSKYEREQLGIQTFSLTAEELAVLYKKSKNGYRDVVSNRLKKQKGLATHLK